MPKPCAERPRMPFAVARAAVEATMVFTGPSPHVAVLALRASQARRTFLSEQQQELRQRLNINISQSTSQPNEPSHNLRISYIAVVNETFREQPDAIAQFYLDLAKSSLKRREQVRLAKTMRRYVQEKYQHVDNKKAQSARRILEKTLG